MCALLKVMRRSYSLEPHITTYLWYGSAIGKVTSTMPMFYFTTTQVIIKYDLRTCRDETIFRTHSGQHAHMSSNIHTFSCSLHHVSLPSSNPRNSKHCTRHPRIHRADVIRPAPCSLPYPTHVPCTISVQAPGKVILDDDQRCDCMGLM
jgi:hypothetical protein